MSWSNGARAAVWVGATIAGGLVSGGVVFADTAPSASTPSETLHTPAAAAPAVASGGGDRPEALVGVSSRDLLWLKFNLAMQMAGKTCELKAPWTSSFGTAIYISGCDWRDGTSTPLEAKQGLAAGWAVAQNEPLFPPWVSEIRIDVDEADGLGGLKRAFARLSTLDRRCPGEGFSRYTAEKIAWVTRATTDLVAQPLFVDWEAIPVSRPWSCTQL